MFTGKGKKLLYLFVLFLLPFFSQPSQAQEEIFSLGMQLGAGARAIAMGGAYSSLGGDYSATIWNPATLADVKRIEVYGSMSHLMRQNDTALLNNQTFFSKTARGNDANFTKFNDFGVAYPVPTIQGSLVFAFGYNRIKSFDSNFDFRTFNQTSDDLVNQAWKEIENGGLNVWNLSGAVDVTPNVSVGATLNFWTGGSDFESTFREVDIDDNYTFDSYTVENGLNTDISGFNAKLGAVYRAGIMRFAATMATPVTFKVKEDWTFNENLTFDDLSFSDSTDAGFFEYKIKSPFTFTGGASLNLLNFVFSGDVEYNDWTQIRYKTEPPIADVSQTEANRSIQDNYRATTRIHLGAEFTLPLTGVSFRAGYFRDPSIFQDSSTDEDKQFLSAGVGFLLDRQVKLDVAFVHGFWKNFNTGLPETTDVDRYVEDIKVNKLFVSLAFRL